MEKKYTWIWTLFVGMLLGLGFSSCTKDKGDAGQLEQQTVLLNITQGRLSVGDNMVLIPKFSPPAADPESYAWRTSDSAVVNLTPDAGYSALVTALAEGNALVTLLSPEGDTLARCKVTVSVGTGGSGSTKTMVLINLGNQFAAGWNTLAGFHTGDNIANLKDDKGNLTGIALNVTEAFNDINGNGVSATTTDFVIPSSVSTNSYYGNGIGVWLGKSVKESQLMLLNLDKTKTYDMCFFASRNGVTDNREAEYLVQGDNGETAVLDAANNASKTSCVSGIHPNSEGKITITIRPGPNNNNASGFYYLGAIFLSYE